jgi:hypothetical protein
LELILVKPPVSALTVNPKMAVLTAIACTIATTSLQSKPDAEPKSAVSAKSIH